VADANRAATILAELGTADSPPVQPVRNPATGAGMR
jgi:hypothetical protein